MVKSSSVKTHGIYDPSGLDAYKWRRLLTSFMLSSTDLCKTIAKLAIRIATVHFIFLLSFNLCQLIALDKCPGVQPIKIGAILGRIIRKAFFKCNEIDFKFLSGDQRPCTEKKGTEHAIQTL